MTINKGGRKPKSPDGPLDDTYSFRTYSRVLRAFLKVADPSVLTQFMSWFIGDEKAELPERPHLAKKPAA